MSEETALRAWVRLNGHPEIGPVRFHRLLQAFGSVEAALGKSAAKWCSLDLRMSPANIEKSRREIDRFDADADIAVADKQGVRLVRFMDDGYPVALLEMEAPPPLLYLKGNCLPQDRFALAVVGTRLPSRYGMEQTSRLAGELCRAGFTIVSGLARGIDACAHRTALQAGGRTLAVMGRGLSRIFPPANAELADQIVAQGGCLVSQFPMEFPGAKWTFPVRNGVISGLAQGVLVVEGRIFSGSLITAHLALNQVRDVFALPGRANSPLSEGPHRLLRQGARLCERIEDILEELRELPPAARQLLAAPAAAAQLPLQAEAQEPGLTGQEARLHQLLLGADALSAEEIALRSGMAAGQVAAVMTMMEIKGVVKALPGNRYEALCRLAAA
jgi:DNA processing protein